MVLTAKSRRADQLNKAFGLERSENEKWDGNRLGFILLPAQTNQWILISMLGLLRLALAVLVSLNHLWIIYGVGRLAVFSFYVISGYLMTTILTDTYGLNRTGVRRYAENRLLRIYPAYLSSFLVFAVVFQLFDRSTLTAFSGNLLPPSSILDWFRNLTLIGLDFWTVERTIPPSWTLYVELVYYAIIPIILSLGKRALTAWLLISIAYHAYLIWGAGPGDPSLAWEQRYGSVAAGSLGFAVGAWARLFLPRWMKTQRAFYTALALFCTCFLYSIRWALSAMPATQTSYLATVAYYGAVVCAAPVVDFLARMPKRAFSEWLGEFSYPYYLLHLPVGFLVFDLIGAQQKTAYTACAGIAASLVAAYVLVRIDRRISKIRSRLRPRGFKSW